MLFWSFLRFFITFFNLVQEIFTVRIHRMGFYLVNL